MAWFFELHLPKKVTLAMAIHMFNRKYIFKWWILGFWGLPIFPSCCMGGLFTFGCWNSTVTNGLQQLKSRWHSPYILVSKDHLLTYPLVFGAIYFDLKVNVFNRVGATGVWKGEDVLQSQAEGRSENSAFNHCHATIL